MRIGVVCEGPTDWHAIVSFLRASLEDRGIVPMFVSIQPEMDRTNPSGGWLSVLRWLRGNPPKSRIPAYLRGGLFDDGLSAKQCDVLIFQMDADILSHDYPRNWIKEELGYVVMDSTDPMRRGRQIRSIIGIAGDFQSLLPSEVELHVPVPAVESTETWCVAAFQRLSRDPERLQGDGLCQAFMTALHRSEGRPMQSFMKVNKTPTRRKRFARSIRGNLGCWRRSVITIESW